LTSAIARVIAGALFAATAGLFPVQSPGAKTAGPAAETFIFLLLHDFGAGALTIATDADVISWPTSQR
jgi:hypothetical protein